MAPRPTVEDEKAATLKRLTKKPVRVAWAQVGLRHLMANEWLVVCGNCDSTANPYAGVHLRTLVGTGRVAYEKRGRLYLRSQRPSQTLPRAHREPAGWKGTSGRYILTTQKTCWYCGARLDWRSFMRRLHQLPGALDRRYSAASSTKPE